jgi:hypothetical protein
LIFSSSLTSSTAISSSILSRVTLKLPIFISPIWRQASRCYRTSMQYLHHYSR